MKEKDVDAFVEGFVASAKDGTWAEKGYSDKSYCMSKVALSALTRDPIFIYYSVMLRASPNNNDNTYYAKITVAVPGQ